MKFRSDNLPELLGQKHFLFRGVAEEIEYKSESNGGLHVVRVFLKVRLT